MVCDNGWCKEDAVEFIDLLVQQGYITVSEGGDLLDPVSKIVWRNPNFLKMVSPYPCLPKELVGICTQQKYLQSG